MPYLNVRRGRPRHEFTEIVTVDLDSTLCDTSGRAHLIDRVNGTDWKAYALACVDDPPFMGVVQAVRLLQPHYGIVIVSGRHAAAYEATDKWLNDHEIYPEAMYLDEGDWGVQYRNHAEYKLAQVQRVAKDFGKPVSLHWDDWPDVCALMRENGINAVCVNPMYGDAKGGELAPGA